ncbi:uncharacterized protein LOC143287687 [Babylonia areolata]|uniref:uncharacterized protein LOC143287687 n=1 Tax=Babylonia areolata TaxID=304850 RepID=UPI003FD3F2B8
MTSRGPSPCDRDNGHGDRDNGNQRRTSVTTSVWKTAPSAGEPGQRECIVWTPPVNRECIVWTPPVNRECIVWTPPVNRECIVWTPPVNRECIVWTPPVNRECIVWTPPVNKECIVWTSSINRECIVWTLFVNRECIVWTAPVNRECIVWTPPVNRECIVWTPPVNRECIVWTPPVNRECIVWTPPVNRECIVWTPPVNRECIVWTPPVNRECIVWTPPVNRECIVWTPPVNRECIVECIVWTPPVNRECIVWAPFINRECIVWTPPVNRECIVWAPFINRECIVWTPPVNRECIVWTPPVNRECIVWTAPVNRECIVWTPPVNRECIVWTPPVNRECIVWTPPVNRECIVWTPPVNRDFPKEEEEGSAMTQHKDKLPPVLTTAIFLPTLFFLLPLLLLPLLLLSQAQVSAVSSSATGHNKRLVRADHCPGQVMGWTGRNGTTRARSLLECLAHCGPHDQCLSIVFDASSRECSLCSDISRMDCSNMVDAQQPDMIFYETEVICEKEEEVPGPGGVCVCAEGYRGNPCAPYIGDCQEGYSKGNFSGHGVYTIHPLLSAAPFPVYCKQMTNNVRTYILDRRANKVDFNRSYADYQAGFGQLSGDHWLGLDKVYELTNSKTYELRVSAKLKNGSNLYMQYQEFNVSGREDGYRLLFNKSFAGVYLLGDCFSPLWGSRFSTPDHDQDEADAVNCAARHGGGWWFRGDNCSTCNPTGPLLKPSSGFRTGLDAEAFWSEDLGDLALYRMTMFLVHLG